VQLRLDTETYYKEVKSTCEEVKMKGLSVGLVGIILIGCATVDKVENFRNLDRAIEQVCQNIQNNFTERAIVAVLNIVTSSDRLSEYIIEEAMNNFTNMHNYTVLERNKISTIFLEQNFQLSGNVSDDTIQSIGNMLGAQYVVTGALDDVGSYYRLRLFVIAIESGERKSSTAVNIIKPNEQIVYLSGDSAKVVLDIPSNKGLFDQSSLSPRNIEGYDSDGRAIVSILPFVGEQKAAVTFNQAAAAAVAGLLDYSPRIISEKTVEAAGVRIPTDMPPVRELVPGARFAVTGGVYPGSYEGQHYLYLQLWLWDMSDSTFIYTDDLVYQDTETGLEDLPDLVEWLFSHIVYK
jgi:TolB-like protein